MLWERTRLFSALARPSMSRSVSHVLSESGLYFLLYYNIEYVSISFPMIAQL